jgi:hypothetical protein
MQLVQLLLPVRDNEGKPFGPAPFLATREELVNRFGGITTYTRAPASGLWKPQGEAASQDDLWVYEVVVPTLDREWWSAFRKKLERTFRQESILIRAIEVSLL